MGVRFLACKKVKLSDREIQILNVVSVDECDLGISEVTHTYGIPNSGNEYTSQT